MLIDLSNKTWGTGNYSPNISERLTPVFNQILEAFDKYHTEKARSKFLKEIGFIKETPETRKETQMRKGTVDVGSPDWNDMAKSMMSQGTVVTPESGPMEKMIPTQVDVPTGRMNTSYDPSVLSKFGIGDVTIPGSGGITASGKAQNPFAGAIPQADGLNINGTVIPWEQVQYLNKGGVGFRSEKTVDPRKQKIQTILDYYTNPETGQVEWNRMSKEDKKMVGALPPDTSQIMEIIRGIQLGQGEESMVSPAAPSALSQTQNSLPADDEILSSAMKSGAKNGEEIIKFLQDKYRMSPQQALEFYRSH